MMVIDGSQNSVFILVPGNRCHQAFKIISKGLWYWFEIAVWVSERNAKVLVGKR
jgi:hypothetical protein